MVASVEKLRDLFVQERVKVVVVVIETFLEPSSLLTAPKPEIEQARAPLQTQVRVAELLG